MNRLHIALQISQSFQRTLLCACNNVAARNPTRPLCDGGGFKQKYDAANKADTQTTKTTTVGAAKNKGKTSPKITLIGQNQAVSVTSLEEAQKLAKRRDMQLLLEKELDTKTQRPVYKLVTAAALIKEELAELNSSELATAGVGGKEKSVQHKSEKSLTIGARISEHDLASRVKHIIKWLQKQHEVRILIQTSATDAAGSEKMLKTIEEAIKKPEVIGKIVQKRTKGATIKFSILPVMPQETTATPA